MEIDIYQQCPCHEDKKIKFCCGKDIVDDLNQVLAKNEAGQHSAALTRLEKAIEAHGQQDCLLTLQAHILITTGQLDKARESNQAFLTKNPDHSTGLQHRALIELGEGKITEAINSLQDSMEAMTGDTIPLSVANAFRIFSIALAQQGNILSSRAHVNFAGSLKPNDEQLKEILFHTYRIPELPLMLKKSFVLPAAPEDQKDAEWAKKYETIFRVMDRGQFRKALKGLNKINQMEPGRPEIATAIAILTCVMNDREAMSPAWRNVSGNETLTHWDRVEAECVAQLLDVQPIAGSVDIVRLSMDVTETEAAIEALEKSERLIRSPQVPEDIFNEGPPPKAAFFFLDKVEVADPASLTADNVPCVLGELLVYGKQTDRSARIECVATQDGRIESLREAVEADAKDVLNGDPKESVLGQADRAAIALTWNWHLPKGVTRAQHTAMVQDYRKKAVLGDWSKLNFSTLGGKSPVDAAKDDACKVALDAMLLNLEQSADSQISGTPISQLLREELGVDPLPPIGAEQVDDTTNPISPVRQQYLDFNALSDEQILRVHSESIALGNVPALRKLVPLLIERESLHSRIPLDISYSMLAELTENDDEAMEHLSKSRTLAKDRGQPVGGLLVQEFEQRLSRGLTEKLTPLLQRIQKYHLQEPNVEMQLARVLQRFGLIDSEGRPSGAPDGGGPTEEAAIWTGDDAGSGDSGETGESKLWLPD